MSPPPGSRIGSPPRPRAPIRSIPTVKAPPLRAPSLPSAPVIERARDSFPTDEAITIPRGRVSGETERAPVTLLSPPSQSTAPPPAPMRSTLPPPIAPRGIHPALVVTVGVTGVAIGIALGLGVTRNAAPEPPLILQPAAQEQAGAPLVDWATPTSGESASAQPSASTDKTPARPPVPADAAALDITCVPTCTLLKVDDVEYTLGTEPIAIAPGQHTVLVAAANGRRKMLSINLKPNKTEKLIFQLTTAKDE